MKEFQKCCLIPLAFITNATDGIWISYCSCPITARVNRHRWPRLAFTDHARLQKDHCQAGRNTLATKFSIIAFAMTKVWLRSLPISARTRYAPGWFKTNKIGPTFSFQVAAIETRSLPSSLAAAPSRLYLLSRRSLGSVDLNPESVRGSGERSGPGDRDTDGQAEGWVSGLRTNQSPLPMESIESIKKQKPRSRRRPGLWIKWLIRAN